ncbi:amino acid ABC transporter permease [Ponticoccus sp. SC2-23]|uniref:amino acid ABC transporter permease n=1 Tax=Alexandriicola marinus TaxID=2081710 RepID=UPI000FD75E16|nr:amino acid ABC transporter permease [Alexandriicola marinus]MBM1219198.1 amino acid ABC transporter permease [Ponticoccus sp. SC6-9]MBM1223730.1 amino acid ABC transporter permease [Ponticoccus sp. SC6-15]MBM1229011.1 amino acid ABC transporter permease [Ponticoccus sp. SC6-38]MBM1232696.1 amino acid ABC transporter permease [Ponticoccus sp. SC6-45]MBM1237354.1 amino acid ABC transporter permease [Ponticoccus sp. SC6-49]MBM1241707.1 amino acid ABC transporter permease [Ponticoccus sp. SC2-
MAEQDLYQSAAGDKPAAPTRREAYEASVRRRSNRIALTSTAVVLLSVFILVPLAPGWEAVQRSFFNGEVFAKTFPGLLNAFLLDVMIFAWCAPLIALVGLGIALCRDVRAPALFPLRLFGAVYTDVFRGLPVVLVIYLIGFGIPGLGLPRPWNSPYIWGSLALILVYAAYVAEVIRSGIDSIHQSQRAAAASLGLSDADTMRFVVLPQAIRNVVPANMNLFIALQKDVALLSFIGPVEIFRQAGVYKSLYANFTPYVGAALIFLALTIPATRYADYLMNKQNRRRR